MAVLGLRTSSTGSTDQTLSRLAAQKSWKRFKETGSMVGRASPMSFVLELARCPRPACRVRCQDLDTELGGAVTGAENPGSETFCSSSFRSVLCSHVFCCFALISAMIVLQPTAIQHLRISPPLKNGFQPPGCGLLVERMYTECLEVIAAASTSAITSMLSNPGL